MDFILGNKRITVTKAQKRKELELEEENARLRIELRNQQQANHLKAYVVQQLEKKVKRLEKDCKHIEQAFENYVNEKEGLDEEFGKYTTDHASKVA